MQAGQPKAQQRQMLVLVYKPTIIQGGNIMIRVIPDPKQFTGADGFAAT